MKRPPPMPPGQGWLLADQRQVSGVQGWLALFLVLLVLVSPAIWVYRLARSLNNSPNMAFALGDRWPLLQALEWAFTSACILGLWFIAYRLFYVRVPRSVTIAIAGIWLVNLGGLLVEGGLLLAMTGAPIEVFFDKDGATQLVRPIVFNLVWTAYLLKSRRVANTYRGGAARTEIFE